MKIINSVLYFLVVIFKGLFVILQLLFMLIYALVIRIISTGKFKNELRNCRIPPDVVAKLGRSYRDMVSLDFLISK